MNVMELTARLLGRRRAMEDNRRQSRAEFIDAFIGGKLKDGEIDAGLEQHNLTPEELTAEVEGRASRKGWQATLATAPAIQAQEAENEKAFATAQAEYNAALAKFTAARDAYHAKAAFINARQAEITDARRRLAMTTPANARRAVERLDAQLDPRAARIVELKGVLSVGDQYRSHEANATLPTFAGRRKELKARIERTKRENHFDERKHVDGWRDELSAIECEEKAARAELAKLEKEVAELTTKAAKAREEMLAA